MRRLRRSCWLWRLKDKGELKKMNRPYIICHMVTSIDGKVTGKFLESEAGLKAAEQYYKIHREFGADGFICGKIIKATDCQGSLSSNQTEP